MVIGKTPLKRLSRPKLGKTKRRKSFSQTLMIQVGIPSFIGRGQSTF
jgi:hypothetical protein